MGDITPLGLPVGHGNSKIRRKQLDIMGVELGIEQRHVEITEKEEEIARMITQKTKLVEELRVLQEQFGQG